MNFLRNKNFIFILIIFVIIPMVFSMVIQHNVNNLFGQTRSAILNRTIKLPPRDFNTMKKNTNPIRQRRNKI